MLKIGLITLVSMVLAGCGDGNGEHHHDHDHHHHHDHHHDHDHDHGIDMSEITWVVSTTSALTQQVVQIGGHFVGTYTLVGDEGYGDILASMSASVIFFEAGEELPWFFELMASQDKVRGVDYIEVMAGDTAVILNTLIQLSPENEAYFVQNKVEFP